MELNHVSIAPVNAGSLSGVWIQGYSRAAVSCTEEDVTLLPGETRGELRVTLKGTEYRPSPAGYTVTGALEAGQNTLICTLLGTDGDGELLQSVLEVTVTVQAYVPPTGVFALSRCDEEGNDDPEGGCVRIEAEVLYSPLGGENGVTTQVWLRLKNGGDFAAAGSIEGSGTLIAGGGVLRSDRSYEFLLRSTDRVGNSAEYSRTVYSEFWALRFSSDGHGASFGKGTAQSGVLTLAPGMKLKLGNTEFTEAQLQELLARSCPAVQPQPAMELLWENQSPTLGYAAGSVVFDTAPYNFFVVQTKQLNNSALLSLGLVMNDGEQHMLMMSTLGSGTSYYYKRGFTCAPGGIAITQGYRNASAGNNYMIPLKIWGVKGLIP